MVLFCLSASACPVGLEPDQSLDLGDVCFLDAECQSGQCECENFDCTIRICAAVDCLCGYGTSGACTDPIVGTQDPEDCDLGSETCFAIDDCSQSP